jgi:hypothetical protein
LASAHKETVYKAGRSQFRAAHRHLMVLASSLGSVRIPAQGYSVFAQIARYSSNSTADFYYFFMWDLLIFIISLF